MTMETDRPEGGFQGLAIGQSVVLGLSLCVDLVQLAKNLPLVAIRVAIAGGGLLDRGYMTRMKSKGIENKDRSKLK